VLLVACAGALVYATVAHGIHLPGAHDAASIPSRSTDAALRRSPACGRPARPLRGGDVGQAWSFNPAEIRVPAGAEVTFISTSVDVLHGFNIEGTRVNVMLIPGQVSRTGPHLPRAGRAPDICHEYCGVGHHFMHGKVIVE
jgi:cytochrome c oxidase subunit II